MKTTKLFCLIMALIMALSCAAMAETVSFEGTVTAGETCEVYAPIGGTVASVSVEAGQKITEGAVIAELRTNKVYAEEDGKVTGIFARPGDSAETVASRYGAVMYIQQNNVYTISASTNYAYETSSATFVTIGETVALSCNTDGRHVGSGVITSIDGTSFTVEVTRGAFPIGEAVNVYRSEVKYYNRLGRGNVARKSPLAITSSGSIVSFAVKDGDTVSRGDLLFETLDGAFDGLVMTGTQIKAPVSGTVASVNVTPGSKADKNSVAAVIYPETSMRIKGQIYESALTFINEGDPVTIELVWNLDTQTCYEGTVAMISAISSGESENGDALFDVTVDFAPGADTRFGMNAIISTMEKTSSVSTEIAPWEMDTAAE